MIISDTIKAIETSQTRKTEWFYHAFLYKEKLFQEMTTQGIKCRKLMSKEFKEEYRSTGHNGNHYISLSKMETVESHNSSYLYYEERPAFIIDDIKVQKCTYAMDYGILEKTRWPFRHSGFLDEYQAYRIIRPDNFVGIRASILMWYQEDYRYYLESLKKMILFLQEHSIDIPIYDYSRAFDYRIHQINPEAYLKIFDSIIEELETPKIKKK